MENEKIYPIGKAIIGVTWLLATACFFPPLESHSLGGFGRSLFGVLAVVHSIAKANQEAAITNPDHV